MDDSGGSDYDVFDVESSDAESNSDVKSTDRMQDHLHPMVNCRHDGKSHLELRQEMKDHGIRNSFLGSRQEMCVKVLQMHDAGAARATCGTQ